MKQIELARLLNLDKSTVHNYVRQGRTPSADILERIAEIFGVSVDYLLGRDTSWLESLPPELRELLSNPNNRDILDVVAQLAKGGATADQIRTNLKSLVALKKALKEIGE